MDKTIVLYSYGKHTANGPWWIDSSKIVHRLYYVKHGKATIMCGKKEITLTSGNIYILPPNRNFISIDSFEFEHIYFDYYCIPIICPDSFVEIPDSSFSLNQFFSFFNDIMNSCDISKETALYFLNGILSVINSKVKFKYINEKSIIKALDIIEKNKMSITTKDLAEQLNLNECYFIRLFSRTLGTTPMKYIRMLRLSEGRLLIKNGCNIAQAAEKCGYKTSAAFWKAMFSEFGNAPSEFKKHKTKEIF